MIEQNDRNNIIRDVRGAIENSAYNVIHCAPEPCGDKMHLKATAKNGGQNVLSCDVTFTQHHVRVSLFDENGRVSDSKGFAEQDCQKIGKFIKQCLR